ncbi:MAG: hypothetical protein K0Q79_2823 [Flavipsychrobacter sp.]|jgi:hypothetical protein|nr:hypothetical protein [Flavipsychrobacter sp.]
MEKILVLADAQHYKPDVLDFAAYIAKLGKSKLVGIFVENRQIDTVPTIKTFGGTPYVEEIIQDPAEQKEILHHINNNIAAFKEGCLQREVNAAAHYDPGDPLEKLLDESRYADLLIADPSFSTDDDDDRVPSKFIMEILSKAECPVLVAPGRFEQIDEVVLAYDGSRSSVFAIKQFYYQLPKLADKRLVILHINKEKIEKWDKQNANFKEWLDMHFSNVSFLELTGEARNILFEYFMARSEQVNQLLVTGAFGRSFLSTFFKPGAAELVLKAVDIPMFISHH